MQRIAIKYGSIMAAGFILYFLVMQALGFGGNYYFRIFNAIIHLSLITLAIKAFKDEYPDKFNYLSGVSAGIVTSLIGVVPFAIFMLVFLYLTPDFMDGIRSEAENIGGYLTPFTASLIVLLEGMAVSILASYIIMRIVDSYR